eukprot:2475308-Amphidinium_carterae.1
MRSCSKQPEATDEIRSVGRQKAQYVHDLQDGIAVESIMSSTIIKSTIGMQQKRCRRSVP